MVSLEGGEVAVVGGRGGRGRVFHQGKSGESKRETDVCKNRERLLLSEDFENGGPKGTCVRL